MSSFTTATAVVAAALLAAGAMPASAEAAARTPGLDELWEEYPLDAKRDLPMPRERLPEQPKASVVAETPPPAAVAEPGGAATLGAIAWIAIAATGALLVAALSGVLVYVGHAPRVPHVRLPSPSFVRVRRAWRGAALAASGGVTSARVAVSRRRVVNDLVRIAGAAAPRNGSEEARMDRTGDIEVLKAKSGTDEAEALKAKAAAEGRHDKVRLAASGTVALKEKLAVTPEPSPKLREHPVARTGRTRARRTLRPVPAPAFVPVLTEACEIRWWRGYVKSQFSAVTTDADGIEATVASSPYFRWRKSAPPEESPAAAAALRTLAETLERDGWKPVGRGAEWFAIRFERDFGRERIEATAGHETGT